MFDLNKTQIGGNHYTSKSVQPWEAMQAWMSHEEFTGFLRGNVIKYIARCNEKGGIEDLEKARHYLDKLIETLEIEPSTTNTDVTATIQRGSAGVNNQDVTRSKFVESLQIIKDKLTKRFPKTNIVNGNSIHVIVSNNPETNGDAFTRDVASMWECVNAESERLGIECYKQNLLPYHTYPIIVFLFREIK